MNYLFMKYSGLALKKLFSDNFGATALAVATEFETPDVLAEMDIEQLTEFVAQKGKNRFSDPTAVAKAVQAAARGSYRLPQTVNDSVNQNLAISMSSIRALGAQIKALEKEIARQFENIQNTLTSVPGIGLVYSAGIIAEIGDINRFAKGQSGLAKYAGLAWKGNQSGTFVGEDTHMIRSGNRYLK